MDKYEIIINSIKEAESEFLEMKDELDDANVRLERARQLFRSQKDELEKAPQLARKSISKDLQIVRDRIYVIGDTIAAAEQRRQNTKKGINADELNTIVDSLGLIISELRRVDLWDDDSPIPPLEHVSDKSVRKKPTGRKTKKEANLESPEADSSPDDLFSLLGQE